MSLKHLFAILRLSCAALAVVILLYQSRGGRQGEEIESEEIAGGETAAEETIILEETAFYHTPLTDEIKARITGKSYPGTQEPLQVSYEDLEYVHVLHYDLAGQAHEGELVCNKAIARDLVEIFAELYRNEYPVEKVRLIDEYNADDDASVADNNTSCFNYRVVAGGGTKLSKHAYGLAIDVNPLYNPYVTAKDGEPSVLLESSVPYIDRSADFPYKIDKNDLCYKLFIEHGFTWGGAWTSVKDYQHFQKIQ